MFQASLSWDRRVLMNIDSLQGRLLGYSAQHCNFSACHWVRAELAYNELIHEQFLDIICHMWKQISRKSLVNRDSSPLGGGDDGTEPREEKPNSLASRS